MSLKNFIFISLIGHTIYAQRPCKTPDQFDGNCVERSTCSIFNLARKDTRFQSYLEQSKCSDTELVCCLPRFVTKTPSKPSSQSSSDTELNNNFCGEINEDKISHGNKTFLGEFPFMALLGYRTESGSYDFKCGGSLISPRYVLTAAHCLSNTLISVRLGEHTLDNDEDCRVSPSGRRRCAPPVKDVSIEMQIKHPQYDKNKKINDIALLRLSESIPLNDRAYINTVCLPTEESLKLSLTESHVIVAGWGRTEDSFRSKELLKATVPVQNIQSCIDTFKLNGITESNIICAGGENLVDSCKGDSGGPLFWKGRVNRFSRYIQHGVTASGYIHCGQLFRNRTPPAIYTNVANYIDWIKSNMN